MTDRAAIELKTDRLILRPIAPDDFDAHAGMMTSARVARFLSLDRLPQSRQTAWRAFASMLGHWTMRGYGFFSVFEKAGGQWVGRVGPWMPEGWPGTEVGWGLARHTWGKGYATEAAEAAIDWAFASLGWSEVIHCIHPDNAPSQAVARRLGSRILRPGKLPHPMTMPVEIWGQSAEDWRARKKA